MELWISFVKGKTRAGSLIFPEAFMFMWVRQSMKDRQWQSNTSLILTPDKKPKWNPVAGAGQELLRLAGQAMIKYTDTQERIPGPFLWNFNVQTHFNVSVSFNPMSLALYFCTQFSLSWAISQHLREM